MALMHSDGLYQLALVLTSDKDLYTKYIYKYHLEICVQILNSHDAFEDGNIHEQFSIQ